MSVRPGPYDRPTPGRLFWQLPWANPDIATFQGVQMTYSSRWLYSNGLIRHAWQASLPYHIESHQYCEARHLAVEASRAARSGTAAAAMSIAACCPTPLLVLPTKPPGGSLPSQSAPAGVSADMASFTCGSAASCRPCSHPRPKILLIVLDS